MTTHPVLQGSCTINAAGNGRVRFDGPSLSDWFIERAVFSRASGGAGAGEVCGVYVGSVDDSGLRDGTVVGTFPFVVGDESSPIIVPVSTPFFGAISGGTAGDVFTVSIQIRADDIQAEDDAAATWAAYGNPDSLLNEHGFPNTNRLNPAGRR